ncbi:MAG: imidazoleglycerol-phosphate dehydratase HisB [Oscillospiraceae bacterium]|jgi:imidazoleglycerol-phosphate dehydratase|nr:imidazoleglycerol-phosphate dehydratase HisB [Oscillospiraceae bacterium]
MREAKITRKTTETDISLTLNLDGGAGYSVSTGVPFLDHCLELFARHGAFNLAVTCNGDTHIDAHHSVEDIGIVLGSAFAEALGEKRGIRRYGSIILPMDETLVLAAVDISGRAHIEFDLGELPARVGEFDTELAREFWISFVRAANVTLHIRKLSGTNGHHIIEAAFKAAARALRAAVSVEPGSDEVPSTKGVL